VLALQGASNVSGNRSGEFTQFIWYFHGKSISAEGGRRKLKRRCGALGAARAAFAHRHETVNIL